MEAMDSLKQSVKDNVGEFLFLIKGQGVMTGKKFAQTIRKCYLCSDETEETRMNKRAAEWAERNIYSIDYKFNGKIGVYLYNEN